ncbi:hypothetical protein Tco_1365438 [Tanacetum coccineum]
MAELVRLQICEELDDTWAWVALGPERQQVAAVGTPEVAEDTPVVDEGAPAVPAPVQEPQPPPASGPARTVAQRSGRLEEDVHGLRGALGEQREVLYSMARDFSRFTTWTVTRLSRMMDQAGVRIKPGSKFSKLARLITDSSTISITKTKAGEDLAGKEIDKVGEVSFI